MATTFATRLVVSGATTAPEARKAEQVLAAVPGVDRAHADPVSRMVVVRHEEAVTVAELVAALEKAGFRARHALPGEGSAAYASSPWGVLRPEGRTPAQEVAVCRFLTVAGLLIVGLILALPVLVVRADHVRQLGFVLASVAQAMLGARFYAGAWRELRTRRPGTDVLISLATTSAYLYSAAEAFEWLQPHTEYNALGALTIFGTSAAILTIMVAGRLLETLLVHRTNSALRALIELAPPTARVLRGSEERQTLACDLVAGDLVAVGPGERFPADGTVVEGHSAADESVLSGEALPVPKCPGDQVLGGTVNGNGRLVFRTEKVCSGTALAQLVRRLSEAGRAQPSSALAGERLAQVIVLGAVLMAVAVFFSSYYGNVPGTAAGRTLAAKAAMLRAVAILVVACPWAVLAAVPGAYAAAVARAAREGIVFRSGGVLEACARLRAAVFLRSGILTIGRPDLVHLVKADGAAGMPDDEVLAAASSLAEGAGHPLGRSLREALARHQAAPREVCETFYFPGLGAKGRLIGGESLVFGRRMFMAQEGIDLEALSARAAEMECAGLTVRFLAINGRAVAIMAFSDPVRPGAGQVTTSLSDMGVASYVISGETPATVQVLAAQTGIDHDKICAEVRPAERSARLRAIRERAGATLAVGQEDKDEDLLRSADVGVVIGAGVGSPAEAPLITLIGGGLQGVRRLLCLAREMVGSARLNLFAAVAFILIGLPAAAALVPAWVHPIQAALATVLMVLLVALNCYRLARRSPGPG